MCCERFKSLESLHLRLFCRFYFYCTMIGAKFPLSFSSPFLSAFVQIEILQRATISIIVCVCVYLENGTKFYNFLSHNSHFLFYRINSNNQNWNRFTVIYFKENEFLVLWIFALGSLHLHLHLNLFLC